MTDIQERRGWKRGGEYNESHVIKSEKLEELKLLRNFFLNMSCHGNTLFAQAKRCPGTHTNLFN